MITINGILNFSILHFLQFGLIVLTYIHTNIFKSHFKKHDLQIIVLEVSQSLTTCLRHGRPMPQCSKQYINNLDI